ncbi:MAG TPA: VirB8/TrbF family protein, partial [Bryobacteraceae bacterium]|nr:VirB8/TrbF family protein [Bryobacteraceae bacterium]
MALICALTTGVAIGGLVRISSQSHVVPFVALYSLGRTVAAGPATEASVADGRLKRSTVFSWIENLRMVTIDGLAQREAIDRGYAHIAGGAQAQAFNKFYRNGPPQKRA